MTTAHAHKTGAREMLSLDAAPAGSRVRVVEVGGGAGLARRLAQLNIRVNQALTVERVAPLGGPILVEAAGASVAVGRSLAHKVKVEVLA